MTHDTTASAEPDFRTVEHGPRTGQTILFLHGGSSAGWTWLGQVAGLPDRHLLTPDLPGYAGRAAEPWPGTAGAADECAELIRARAVGGRAHLVGLSLGGFVATQIVQRHPDLVHSCLITGSALSGYSKVERRVIGAQLPLWRKRWYWQAQALAFRIPADSRESFVADASAPSARTNRAMFDEVTAGLLPYRNLSYDGPMLAVSGERDTASIPKSFPDLKAALPQLQTWIAPRMHHAWNAEDPELFTRMVSVFTETGRWPGI